MLLLLRSAVMQALSHPLGRQCLAHCLTQRSKELRALQLPTNHRSFALTKSEDSKRPLLEHARCDQLFLNMPLQNLGQKLSQISTLRFRPG